METNKQKQMNPKTDTRQEVGTSKENETLQGVTVGMGIYKPIPKFKGYCKNC